MSSLENCLIWTYLLWFSTRIQMEKNWGDTPNVTLRQARCTWRWWQQEKQKKVLETILNLKNRQRRCHVKSIIDFWVNGNEVGTSKYFMAQNFMPMSSEFNYDTGEKRIVKTLKLHFVSYYIFMNIFIDLSMVIYQIVDKDRIWLTNWYKSTTLSKLIDKRKKIGFT